jgi:hypothetical protein
MEKQKAIFPEGIAFFTPKENAPDWVKGNVIMSVDKFMTWLKANEALLTENEKYGRQLKLTLTDKGVQVDTWKPSGQSGNVAKASYNPDSQSGW